MSELRVDLQQIILFNNLLNQKRKNKIVLHQDSDGMLHVQHLHRNRLLESSTFLGRTKKYIEASDDYLLEVIEFLTQLDPQLKSMIDQRYHFNYGL